VRWVCGSCEWLMEGGCGCGFKVWVGGGGDAVFTNTYRKMLYL